jgi:hypothetical protein
LVEFVAIPEMAELSKCPMQIFLNDFEILPENRVFISVLLCVFSPL